MNRNQGYCNINITARGHIRGWGQTCHTLRETTSFSHAQSTVQYIYTYKALQAYLANHKTMVRITLGIKKCKESDKLEKSQKSNQILYVMYLFYTSFIFLTENMSMLYILDIVSVSSKSCNAQITCQYIHKLSNTLLYFTFRDGWHTCSLLNTRIKRVSVRNSRKR
jgi:hypothetical protein